MKYLYIINEPPGHFAGLSEAGQQEIVGKYFALRKNLEGSGDFIDGAALHAPKEAKSIRASEGGQIVSDGPYAEAKEVLAGYYIVRAKDKHAAIEIAKEIQACNPSNHIVMRQVLEM
ncbi:MAG: YciI family protein [Candidatus Eremiobacteraeota bacterium]|nr:YciI family protein [Candidatus Eremiobacteraeota bacterium]